MKHREQVYTESVAVRLPKETAKSVRRLARRDGRHLSAFLRVLIEERLSRENTSTSRFTRTAAAV